MKQGTPKGSQVTGHSLCPDGRVAGGDHRKPRDELAFFAFAIIGGSIRSQPNTTFSR